MYDVDESGLVEEDNRELLLLLMDELDVVTIDTLYQFHIKMDTNKDGGLDASEMTNLAGHTEIAFTPGD